MASQNNLKQIQLAVLNFSGQRGDRLPTITGSAPNENHSLFVAALPYLEYGATAARIAADYRAATDEPPRAPTVRVFLDPSDPTLQLGPGRLPELPGGNSPSVQRLIGDLSNGLSSYAANGQLFRPGASLMASIPDGHSNTIAFATHYASDCRGIYFKYALFSSGDPPGVRRATFADGGSPPDPLRYTDHYPFTTGTPPTSRPAIGSFRPILLNESYTFQVAPTPPRDACDPTVAQTPHASGLYVALVDGSVRVLSPAIAQAAYWGAITPAAGEVLSDW